jgi:hypothetical protein
MKTIFAIVYEKTSKKIVVARVETYTHDTDAVSAETHLTRHCENNGLNSNDFSAVELPYTRGQEFDIGKHIYNESTGQLEVSPDWVAPVQPTPVTPTEPTV